jgi:hypothetical protein
MAVVALDPLPFDLVVEHSFYQIMPQILVANRLLAGIDPALAFPAFDPFCHAINDIAAVSVNSHSARFGQYLQCANHGGHFHAVVGRLRLAAAELFLMVSHAQNRAPASRAGIAFAGTIGEYIYFFQFSIAIYRPGAAGVVSNKVAFSGAA